MLRLALGLLLAAATLVSAAGGVRTSDGRVVCAVLDHGIIDAQLNMTIYCANASPTPTPTPVPVTPAAPKPAPPTLLGPSGPLDTNPPTFTWNASAGATSYYLLVQSAGGVTIGKVMQATDLGCASGGTCTASPGVTLKAATLYSWFVTANSAAGASAWSAGKAIKVP